MSALPDTRVADVADTAPDDWNARVVDAPGGSVHQGTAWAAHRVAQGWRPRYVRFNDGRSALVLTDSKPVLGVTAYCPRGPVEAGDGAAATAARVVALTNWLRDEGATSFAVDPVLDASPVYDQAIEAIGFREVEEVMATRHRLELDLPAKGDVDAALRACTKTARQRIRGAAAAGTTVAPSTDEADLVHMLAMLDVTAERKDFGIGSHDALMAWWHRVMEAGQAKLLVARNAGAAVGGLILYRQGGHWATAYSADDPASRATLHGTMHLVRWTAIEASVIAGDPIIDLGGVDAPGFRREPVQGDPMYGLYEHKRSFGARWVPSAAAHELLLQPARYRAGRLAGRVAALAHRRPRAVGPGH